jgi:hypothetical protein
MRLHATKLDLIKRESMRDWVGRRGSRELGLFLGVDFFIYTSLSYNKLGSVQLLAIKTKQHELGGGSNR